MKLYIWKTMQGYRIKSYISAIEEDCHYIGYTEKQAIKIHRLKYKLKNKHLIINRMNYYGG